MSQYWGAVYGDGFLMTYDEFKKFTKAYGEENNLSDEEIENIEDNLYDDSPFVRSEYTGKIKHSDCIDEITQAKKEIPDFYHKTFSVTLIDDEAEGVVFTPFRKPNGSINGTMRDNNGKIVEKTTCDMIDETVYMIWMDKDRIGPQAIENPPYKSVADIEKEIDNKIGKYLKYIPSPKYGAGHISYAIFC